MRAGVSAGGQKLWYSVADLASLNLPGLSPKRNRVVEIAGAGRWAEKHDAAGQPLFRPRAGRGGGWEYHFSLLPPSAAAELAKRGLLEAVESPLNDNGQDADEPTLWGWFEAQPEKVKTDAKARLAVIQQVELTCMTGIGKNTAVSMVARETHFSTATIWNWFKLLQGVADSDRLPALAPRRAGGAPKADIDERIFEQFKSLMLTPSKRTYAGAYFFTARWAKGQGLAMPTAKTLQRRFDAEVPREVFVLKREGVKALMESIPSQERTVAGMHAMSCINIDGHKFDVFVTPPEGGAPIRPMLIGMQDIYSRKFLAWRLCGEESIFHTRLCFADLFEKWGLPERVYMDNGRAFASKYLTGGTKTRFRYVVRETDAFGLLPALGIPNTFATPEHGQAKPIERAFGDLVKFIAKHPACEGAYTGNRVDRKPHNYGSRALPWAEFSVLVDEMIAEYNAYQGRQTEMAKGRSFDQVFFESYGASAIAKATPEQLRMALLEARKHRADAKTGEIRMFGNRYHCAALYGLAGQDVTIRFDPDNLHKSVFVYDLQGRFLAEAPPIEAVGFLDTEAAKAIAKKRAEFRKLARAAAEAEGLLAASELNRMQPAPEPAEDAPRPAATRLVRTRGNSAAAMRIVEHAQPKVDGAQVIDQWGAAVQARQAAKARPQFSLLDGGLTRPQSEPERPK